MKWYLLKNSTQENLATRIKTTPSDNLGNLGSAAATVIDGDTLTTCLAPSTITLPNPVSHKSECLTLADEGLYAIEIDGVVVPFAFNPADLPAFFNAQNVTGVSIKHCQGPISCDGATDIVFFENDLVYASPAFTGNNYDPAILTEWQVEVDGVLDPTIIGFKEGSNLYIEDYLNANYERLGLTGQYDNRGLMIYSTSMENKRVRLIPLTPYNYIPNEDYPYETIPHHGNPTTTIDDAGVISFCLAPTTGEWDNPSIDPGLACPVPASSIAVNLPEYTAPTPYGVYKLCFNVKDGDITTRYLVAFNYHAGYGRLLTPTAMVTFMLFALTYGYLGTSTDGQTPICTVLQITPDTIHGFGHGNPEQNLNVLPGDQNYYPLEIGFEPAPELSAGETDIYSYIQNTDVVHTCGYGVAAFGVDQYNDYTQYTNPTNITVTIL